MKLYKTHIQGNPNVGLYGFCTDKYCLLAPEFTEQQTAIIHNVLDVPVYQLRIAKISLLGALLAGNSRMLLVPNIVFEDELLALDMLRISYTVVPSRLTALGNNILCNDHGALVNPEYSADIQKLLRHVLQVSLHIGTVADAEVPGSCAVHNKKGLVLHAFADDTQKQKIEGLLHHKSIPGTVNFGSPYVRSGVFANSHGMVIGDRSTALEIENIYEALGFLEQHD